LVNTTDAKAYNTARRGVFSGGEVFIQNEIKTARLSSMTMPSISSGCGGIDIYGGSFSFINADQFIETFQAIGSNAIGYGVKLALQGSCDTCESIMTSLEKTMQFLNSMNIDSCTAAQGVVEAGIGIASGKIGDVAAKMTGTLSGVMSDFTEAWNWSNDTGTTAAAQLKIDDPDTAAEILTGNVVWRALKDSNLQTKYGSDTQFLEMLMSMSGTVVFDFSDNDDIQPINYEGYKITLQDLMNGTSPSMYKCDTTSSVDGCLNITVDGQTMTDDGFIDRIKDSYTGTDGMIAALAGDDDWSDNAKLTLGFPSLIGSNCNLAIRKILIKDKTDTARAGQIALACSTRIALDMAYTIVSDLFSTVEPLLENAEFTSQNEAAKNKAQATLKAAKKAYEDEYIRLDKQTDYSAILLKLQSDREDNQNISSAQN
jgi:conjugative transfer pilus assembly protein TraH